MTPAENAVSGGQKRQRSPRKGQPPSFGALLSLCERLCHSLEAQTRAIEHLAQSNEAMVDALMAGESEDEGGHSQHLGAPSSLS